MPKVPTYDTLQVAPQVSPDVRVAATEFQDFGGVNAAKAGDAVFKIGTSAARIGADMINEANAVRVEEALNKVNEAALALRYDKTDGFENIKGEAALNRTSGKPLADEYKEKLNAVIKENGVFLGNELQTKLFQLKANDVLTRFYASANAHEVKQFTEYSLSVQDGTLKNAANAITLDPLNKDNVRDNVEKINQAIYNAGKLKGLSAEQIKATQAEALSGTHMNAVKALVDQENTNGALAYFNEYKKDFNGIQFAEAEKLLKQADVAKVAIAAATQLWDLNKPKTYNEPVDLFKMEEEARVMFDGDPKKLAATISELRNRKSAFDASQSEFNDANINDVGKLLQSGNSLVEIQGSVAFNTLPGKTQLDIVNAINDRNYMLDQRVQAAEDRTYVIGQREIAKEDRTYMLGQRDLAAKDREYMLKQRELAEIDREYQLKLREEHKDDRAYNLQQRELARLDREYMLKKRELDEIDRKWTEKLRGEHIVDRSFTLRERERHQREIQGMAKYFELSNPDVLVGMKREAVAALWPKIGENNTANLLQRWDTLQNKDALLTSRMDQEQFNAIAQQFDLNPFDSKKSTNEKAELGILHNNINAKLEEAAKSVRRPLTREEKEQIMRTEMAKTVTINGFFTNTTKPIAQLSDKDKADVIVPKADRLQIIEQMKLKYEQTKLPVFEPTEENVRFWYLQSKRGAK